MGALQSSVCGDMLANLTSTRRHQVRSEAVLRKYWVGEGDPSNMQATRHHLPRLFSVDCKQVFEPRPPDTGTDFMAAFHILNAFLGRTGGDALLRCLV